MAAELSRRPAPDQLLEAAPVGILSTNRAGVIEWWNAQAARLFPNALQEGRAVRELFDESCQDALDRLLNPGEGMRPERVTCAHGKLHYDMRSAPFGASPDDKGLLLSVVDVTDRNRVEDEVAQALERERQTRAEAERAEMRAAFLARAATELASSLDYRTTLAGIARLAVPDVADWAAVDMLAPEGTLQRVALAHADAGKLALARELHEKYPLGPDDPLSRVIETGQPQFVRDIPPTMLAMYAQDAEHLQSLQTLAPRSSIVVPIRAADQEVVGAITLMTADSGRHYSWADLRLADELADRVSVAIQNARLFEAAEQRRAEAVATADQLRRVNSELEQFAYVTSHDLQEPLRTVASFAQLLQRRHGPELPAEAHDYISHIVEGARRMSHLIHDLLEYSRVSRDEAPRMQAVDLNAVVADCMESLGTALHESGATVTHGNLPVVRRANPSQIQQLFLNLLSNAIKYARRDVQPEIHVDAVRETRAWHLRIKDNGQGFDPQYQERIFGVFKRLHGRDVPGTGIGLALCRRIAERHGGTIWAESRPGEGSVFHFTIAD